MIRKVYELDPLLRPSFEGLMKIIAFIEDPVTIDNIIRHLKLNSQAERPPPCYEAVRNFLRQLRRVGSISEGLCGCFLLIRGRSLFQT
ncbi:MAG: hypothetical protein OEY18_10000 [Candidatus Aminicenantes bacterium]|nr:hypothetical protein [Candidatus Aminicenantes bacterium]MDH5385029.1 hypothetical protein [Candidatus Aminicenantes bacterium]MDH5744459.1 hypothetical protein [Candidatus Aminicenantes bacterium]